MDEEKIVTQTPDEAGETIQQPCGGCEGCGGCAAAPVTSGPVTVVDVCFREGGKVYFFSPEGLEVKTGDHVIIETSRGPEFGVCAAGNHQVAAKDVVQPLRKVLRLATAQDEKTNEQNRKKEKEAFRVCQQKIAEHKLDMQLVSAEYAFDGSKILFFFTAEGRVDFRDLVKNLASVFHTRIELRQIGVRDKAKMVGGLGICGRPFCCKEFLDDFQPVSIKMAKTQNLSLNPTKISGTCGRLMCCLKYEQDAYEDLIKTAPKAESFVDTPDGRGTVTDVNLLRQSVRVRMEKAPDTFGTYKNDEIYIIRSGKAKKTDAPIPEDFAPISSRAAEQPRRRFRDLDEMPEVVLGKKQPQPEPEPEQEKPAHSSHRRHRRPQQDRQASPAEKQPEKKPAEKPQAEKKQPEKKQQERKQQPRPQEQPRSEGGEASKAKSSHRRHRHRGPRKPSGGGSSPAAT
mgnify:CR=1 FL=1